MKRLSVAVSLDVEEEGLFSGRYRTREVPLLNLASLSRLEPLLDLGVRPTFFCAYPVFISGCGQLRPFFAVAEIAAHLHYWNTPPLSDAAEQLTVVPARELTAEAYAAKLQNLLAAGEACTGQAIKSFRMGRWDLHRFMLPLIARMGICCDASVRPLHWRQDNGCGPDHFDAPADPYYVETEAGKILEVPLTVLPLFRWLRYVPPRFLPRFTHWGVLALLSIYHPLWLLQLTTILHVQRGGSVLSLTWHSSEMMAGGAPHMPDDATVQSFLAKMSAYCRWLMARYDVEWVHMADLWGRNFPTRTTSADWAV